MKKARLYLQGSTVNKESALCDRIEISINNSIVEHVTEAHIVVTFPTPTNMATQCTTSGILQVEVRNHERTTNDLTIEMQPSRRTHPLQLEKVPLHYINFRRSNISFIPSSSLRLAATLDTFGLPLCASPLLEPQQ